MPCWPLRGPKQRGPSPSFTSAKNPNRCVLLTICVCFVGVLKGTKVPFTPAADIYSVGVCLHELCTGRVPYHGLDYIDLSVAVAQGAGMSFTDADRAELPAALIALVTRCLSVEPSQRPHAADLVSELRSIVALVDEGKAAPPAPGELLCRSRCVLALISSRVLCSACFSCFTRGHI